MISITNNINKLFIFITKILIFCTKLLMTVLMMTMFCCTESSTFSTQKDQEDDPNFWWVGFFRI
jgi:hypothetical protein